MTTVKKVKTAASVFELPQRLVLQYVEYERLERMREPPQPALVRADPVEELLKEYPELGAFGADWLRAWAPHARDRLVEIANVMRRYPWMAEVLRRRPVANPHPYMVEAVCGWGRVGGVYVSKPAEDLLRPKRRGGGGEAGAGVQPLRGVRGEDKGSI